MAQQHEAAVADQAGFADKEIAKKPHLVHEVKAIDNSNGQLALYYVYVEPPRIAAFTEALAAGEDMNLEAYGRVLAACYGEEPTAEVRALLRKKYGIEV